MPIQLAELLLILLACCISYSLATLITDIYFTSIIPLIYVTCFILLCHDARIFKGQQIYKTKGRETSTKMYWRSHEKYYSVKHIRDIYTSLEGVCTLALKRRVGK